MHSNNLPLLQVRDRTKEFGMHSLMAIAKKSCSLGDCPRWSEHQVLQPRCLL